MNNSQKLFTFGDVPFASPYNVIGTEECRNLYVEKSISPTSKVQSYYVSIPGLKIFSQKDAGNACRGLYKTSDSRLFQAHSNYVDEIFQNGQRITRGYITTYSGNVCMCDNTQQLMLVDGEFGYVLDLATNNFQKVDENTFPNGADYVTNVDTYFIVNVPNSYNFRWSYPNNGLLWDALDSASKIGYPEVIVTLKEMHNQLWVFGTTTTEIFYDTADIETGIFKRIEGASFEVGCAAKHSVTKIENNIFWIGVSKNGTKEIYSNDGLSPLVISTRGIEQLVDKETGGKIDDAIGFSYSQNGHNFYIIQFLSSSLTLAYDTTTKTWHVRSDRDWRGDNVKWRGMYHQLVWGKNIFGDLYTNALYTSEMDYYQNEDPDDLTKPKMIIRERTTPIIQADQKRLRHNSFEVLFESGVGLNDIGFGHEPQVILYTSDDSGISFPSVRYTGLGKIGEVKTRARFLRLGMSRNRVYKVSVTDPVKVVLIGFILDTIPMGS